MLKNHTFARIDHWWLFDSPKDLVVFRHLILMNYKKNRDDRQKIETSVGLITFKGFIYLKILFMLFIYENDLSNFFKIISIT